MSEGYVSRPSLGVELAPDAMSESLGMPGAMVMKAPTVYVCDVVFSPFFGMEVVFCFLDGTKMYLWDFYGFFVYDFFV